MNYYTREITRNEQDQENWPQERFKAPLPERTAMDWEIYPEGLYALLNRLHFEYRAPKLYITENGCAYSDGPDSGGEIDDQARVDYLRRHFGAAHRAIQNGVPLAGYFV